MRKLGHEAYSCDIIECSGEHPEWHIMQDVLPLINGNCEFKTVDGVLHKINGKWDMIIAFPPCTYMSRAGARWMYKGGELQQDRLQKALLAKDFFMSFYNADCDRIAIENPTPLKIVGLPKSTQFIQPYQFGHPYSKKTHLWLKGLPQLQPTKILYEYVAYLPSNVTGKKKGQKSQKGVVHNAKDASKTFLGVAKAMAEQWTDLINS